MDNKTEEKYTKIMRKLNGEERLIIAMKFTELEVEKMKTEIRAQNPNISSEDVEKLLFEKRYGYKRPFWKFLWAEKQSTLKILEEIIKK